MNKKLFDDLRPRVVLAIVAHPDDVDVCAGGTMAMFARQGAAIYYLILTDGGSGSEDRDVSSGELTDTRRAEQRKAGEIVGIKDVFFCDYPDGQLQNTLAVKRDVVKIIRQVQPDVVFAMDPSVLYSADKGLINHPDHRAAGQAALDAVFPLARDHMSFPELLKQGFEPHKTPTLLLFNHNQHNFAVDISETLDTKVRALGAHVSQIGDQEGMEAWVRQMASEAGKQVGTAAAELFMRIDIS